MEHISLYQSLKHPAPDNDAVETLRLILPHIQSALRLRRRISSADHSDFQAALDSLDRGVVLFDERGLCIFMNEMGRKIVASCDGLYENHGRLCALDRRESEQLSRLIRTSITTILGKGAHHGGVVCISRKRGKPLYVTVTPFNSDQLSSSGRAAAIGVITDPELKLGGSEQLLGKLYGLTPAEVRVVQMLCNGLSTREMAASNRVSVETIRSQLKSSFGKTGVRRQSELVALLQALMH